MALLEQMNIFDFIDKPQEPKEPESKTMFESLYENISNPVSQCVNCLCMKCANNVEEVWHKVKQEEQKSRASTVMNAAFILESISTECRGKRIAQVL